MKCFNCGAELTEDTKFCSYCGAKVTAPEAPKEEPVKEKVNEPQVDEVDEDIYDEDEVEEVEEAEEEYEETVPPYSTAQKPKPVSTDKPTLGDKAKSKFKEFWNGLSVFGKLSTVSIALAALLCLIAFLAGRIFAGIIAVVWIAVGVVAILMKKNVIKVPKTWIPLLAIILSFILIVPYFSLFKINIADYEKYNWDEIVLADMLPTPESPYGEIISNSENYLAVYVTKTTQDEYSRYIEACKEKGFAIDTETTGSFFYAYNEQGYKLSLSYYDYNSEMHISLSAGTELGTLEWSDSKLAKMLPTPETTVGNIQKDDEKGFSAYLGNTTIDAFNAYVTACKDKGFTVDANSTDKRFSAKNADGYKLSVEYQGNNVVYVSLAEPEYSVSIEIECVENLIFSKYDVDVYVDDSLEGTVSHGDTETFELTLTKGTYVLKFVNEDDDDVEGKVEFYIEKNENLKYKISCTSSKVDVEIITGTSKPSTSDNQQGTTDYALDYEDAASFEKALNDGVKVNGKIVQFEVLEYKPDSALGINCWAGEHLNFISEEELDVGTGNIIVGQVTKEPTKSLGSWTIHYEVLSIGGEKVEKPDDSQSGDTSEITLTMGEDDFKGMNYQEAEKIFREMGFTKFEYRDVDTETESAADTICYIEITEWFIGDSDFVKGDKFDSDSTVTFFSYKYEAPATPSPVFYSTNDYETAKKGNSGVFSYKNKSGSYDVYWIIDFDEGYVYWFTEGNGESTCDKVKIVSGTLNDKITVTWHDGGDQWSWHLHFKYVNSPVTLIVNDHNGFATEFTTTDLDDALAIRGTKTIKEY